MYASFMARRAHVPVSRRSRSGHVMSRRGAHVTCWAYPHFDIFALFERPHHSAPVYMRSYIRVVARSRVALGISAFRSFCPF